MSKELIDVSLPDIISSPNTCIYHQLQPGNQTVFSDFTPVKRYGRFMLNQPAETSSCDIFKCVALLLCLETDIHEKRHSYIFKLLMNIHIFMTTILFAITQDHIKL